MKIGKENRSTRRKHAPAPLCPPKIPHGETWVWTRAAVFVSLSCPQYCSEFGIVLDRWDWIWLRFSFSQFHQNCQIGGMEFSKLILLVFLVILLFVKLNLMN
jgi:hypothetical protein